mmetsp:Transcript_17249/g.36439  ORF Transcript_17249/g.36439 Transcript_17249/m.36439 type:complete len:90 (+) Transcript_17249:103-372(+)
MILEKSKSGLSRFNSPVNRIKSVFNSFLTSSGSMELSLPKHTDIAKTQEERAESISIFQFSNAVMPKLQNCRSRETKEMCPHATMPWKT